MAVSQKTEALEEKSSKDIVLSFMWISEEMTEEQEKIIFKFKKDGDRQTFRRNKEKVNIDLVLHARARMLGKQGQRSGRFHREEVYSEHLVARIFSCAQSVR